MQKMDASLPNDQVHDQVLRSHVPIGALRRFVQTPTRSSSSRLEHCELCGEPIATEHRHLFELANQALHCTCNACVILFNKEGAGSGKYKVVPRRYLSLQNFSMTDSEWDELMIPVNMAFLVHSSKTNNTAAFYPGPAGATESLLKLTQWETLVSRNPVLHSLAYDVEALLINRTRGTHAYYIVPIDACYQLVGLIRRSWRGLSGGEAVWQTLTAFFLDIQTRAQTIAATTKEGADA